MDKQTNWYLRNWEYQLVGDRRVLVYTGEYYCCAGTRRDWRRLKAAFGLLTAALLAVFYGCLTCGAEGGETVYAGMPAMLAQLPLLFLLLGTISLLPAAREMTYRAYRASLLRIRGAAWVAAALLAAACAGQFVFLSGGGAPAALSKERLWLGGALFCTVDLLGMEWLLHRFPARVVLKGPAPPVPPRRSL